MNQNFPELSVVSAVNSSGGLRVAISSRPRVSSSKMGTIILGRQGCESNIKTVHVKYFVHSESGTEMLSTELA